MNEFRGCWATHSDLMREGPSDTEADAGYARTDGERNQFGQRVLRWDPSPSGFKGLQPASWTQQIVGGCE